MENFSFLHTNLDKVEPVYRELPGWNKDIVNCKTLADLPAQARDYVKFITENARVEIPIISVGPDRMQTIYQSDFLGESSISSSQYKGNSSLSCTNLGSQYSG